MAIRLYVKLFDLSPYHPYIVCLRLTCVLQSTKSMELYQGLFCGLIMCVSSRLSQNHLFASFAVNLGTKNDISKIALAGILVGVITVAVIASVLATVLIIRRKNRSQRFSRKNLCKFFVNFSIGPCIHVCFRNI